MNSLIKKYIDQKCFVNWRLLKVKGRETKLPFQTNGRRASSTNPSTWSTYTNAKKASNNVGIVLHDKKLICIDLDHVLVDGKIEHADKEIIAELILAADSYTEVSQSLTGLHIFFETTEPLELKKNRNGNYEIYDTDRYIALTENFYGEPKEVRTVSIEEANRLLKIIGYPWDKVIESAPIPVTTHSRAFTDETLLKKMFAAKNGKNIETLWKGDISAYGGDTSRADAALCRHLAFWTSKSKEQIERLWLASPLGAREKTKEREDYRVRTINNAIINCKEVYSADSIKVDCKDKEKGSQADILLGIIEGRKDTLLFHDEYSEGYISLDVHGHNDIWSCKSKPLKNWLSHEYWLSEKKTVSSEAIRNVIGTLEGKARFGGLEYRLNNRVAWQGNELWYDLTNKTWQAVKTSCNGWEIIDKPPILFKRYSHNKIQVTPIRDGEILLLMKYININNEQHKLLLMVYLVSCFIPDFPHPMLIIFGSQGSAKSTLSKLLRWIIDPSIIEVASMPENQKELIQTLAHHSFLFFDNVSHISEMSSDTLCKAITGGGFPKRELYSDDEDIIYSFMRCVGMNGINLVATRPDLLERSLLIELERIEPSMRKQESEIIESFKKDLPSVLGGVLDVLVKAIRIKPTVKMVSLPRMADFAVWGCAIAEALGYSQDDFTTAYQNNINRQSEMLLNENIVATAIITFMADKETWRDTPTELLKQLSNHAEFEHIDTREKYWPKGAGALSRRLNELSTNLKQMGILVTISTSGTERWIEIKNV